MPAYISETPQASASTHWASAEGTLGRKCLVQRLPTVLLPITSTAVRECNPIRPVLRAARRGTACQAAPAPSSIPAEAAELLASADPEQPLGSAFLELGADPVLQMGLSRLGITEPSPIQATAIPTVLAGSNVAIQSFTGSGKTLAYLLPALTLALRRAEAIYTQGGGREVSLQALVVAPSQELAMQVVRVAQELLPPEGRTMVQQCIGGANPRNQQDALERNRPLVVVGTPGRLAEFVRTGVLRVHFTPLMVLDEADQLLSPQFEEDMTLLTSQTGKRLGPRPLKPGEVAAPVEEAASLDLDPELQRRQSRQTVLVSATLSQSVLTKTDAWCPNPVYLTAGGKAPALAPQVDKAGLQPEDSGPAWGWGVRGWDGRDNAMTPRTQGSAGGVEGGEGLVPSMPPQLQHFVMVVDEHHKADSLRRVMHAMDLKRALVFMNWQQRLKDVQFKLQARAMLVAVLHGEMPKLARQSVLNDFKRGRLRALVVSDVVARGLDVPDCDAVFHLELPSSAAHYAHRAGRTGRMGASGIVISLAPRHEVWVVEKLAARLGVKIQEMHVSHGEFRAGPPPEGHKAADEEAPASASTPTTASKTSVSSNSSSLTSASSKGDRTGYRENKALRRPSADAPEGQQSGASTVRSPAGQGSLNSRRGAVPAMGAASSVKKGSSGMPSWEAERPGSSRGVPGTPSSDSNPGEEAADTIQQEADRAWAADLRTKLPKGARMELDAEGQPLIYDDDDEMDEVDEAGLEAEELQLAALRAASRGGTRKSVGGRNGGRGSTRSRQPGPPTGPGAGAAKSGGADRSQTGGSSTDIREELRRELDALKEERAGQRSVKEAAKEQKARGQQ